MVRLSPRRNQRSNKGFKVKHALQICLLIGVCIWLLYQVRHSHEKRASFGEGPKTENEIVKMGRKDLRPQVEETTIRDARHKEGEDEEESKDEEEQNKPEESDNAGKGGGNDEIDEHDKVKVEEEKKENVSEENERDKEFEESKEILILGSINGLICISNVAEDIALWNPSIRRHKVLPFLPIERIGSSILGTRVFGFGYDPVNEDYKLVRISQFINLGSEGFVSKVKVYSLRANEWRDSEDMPFVLCYTRKNGTFASGALHWVVNRKFNVEEADLIVAFDLTVERFREVPLPECMEERFHIDVGVLGGCVCMIATYQDVRIDVWVMREYGVKKSWAKLFSVAQADEVVGSFKYLRPLVYSKTDGEVLLELDNQRLVWYDLRGKRVKNVSVAGLPNSFEAEICVGSLVPAEARRRDHGRKQSLGDEKNKKRDDFLSEGFKLVL